MSDSNVPLKSDVLLFAYGSLMQGELHHDALVGATLKGPAKTPPGYVLVDLGPFPAMMVSPGKPVEGELYQIPRKLLLKLDGVKELGRLFHRATIVLESNEQAETYLMNEEQLRGRRRIRVPAWRDRFSRAATRGPLGRG